MARLPLISVYTKSADLQAANEMQRTGTAIGVRFDPALKEVFRDETVEGLA